MFQKKYFLQTKMEGKVPLAPVATVQNLPSDKTFSSILTKICICFSIVDRA